LHVVSIYLERNPANLSGASLGFENNQINIAIIGD
jgi:hypothetical protein